MAVDMRDKRANVHEIQGYLRRIAFERDDIPLIVPDGIYGPETTDAVRAFQRAFGLEQTGVVDRRTWDAIVAEYTAIIRKRTPPRPISPFPSRDTVVQPGDEGDVVYIVQIMLDSISDYFSDLRRVPVSGTFDKQTENAVRDLQLRANMPVTGRVDKETWNMLAHTYDSYHKEK